MQCRNENASAQGAASCRGRDPATLRDGRATRPPHLVSSDTFFTLISAMLAARIEYAHGPRKIITSAGRLPRIVYRRDPHDWTRSCPPSFRAIQIRPSPFGMLRRCVSALAAGSADQSARRPALRRAASRRCRILIRGAGVSPAGAQAGCPHHKHGTALLTRLRERSAARVGTTNRHTGLGAEKSLLSAKKIAFPAPRPFWLAPRGGGRAMSCPASRGE
jgi:hypothetical protein